MAEKRHLMIFCSALQAGGAERVLSILSTPFADHYERVTYLMWQDVPIFYTIDKRVQLVSVERACRGGMLKRLFWMRRYIRRESPDIVLSFSAPFNMLALAALLGTRQRVVVAERIDPRSFRWGYCLNILRRWLYHTADGILTQTPSSKEYFKGALRRKTTVIYNPVVMPDQLVGKAVTEDKHPVVVSVARLVKQKQQEVLIRAFAKFHKSHPTYRLLIYGKGPELERLQREAEMLGVKDVVCFPGVVKEIWPALLSAQMFVMSSQFEGMSNSLIEAMCLGLPCISTKVSGAVDLICHGENGYLVDVGDDEAICCYMQRLADDQPLAQQIGRQAVTLYKALNVDTIAREWIEYIDAMIQR